MSIRTCYVCHKDFEWPSTDPTRPSGYRRCPDCLKIPKYNITWQCSCGQTFKSRDKLYDHRREQRAKGNYCGQYVIPETRINCPFCGMEIGTSKNIATQSDCLVNHVCDGVKEASAIGFSLRATVALLKRLERNNTIKAAIISVEQDKLFQYSWIAGVFERHGIPENVILFDSRCKAYQLVVSYLLKTVFVFDDKIPAELKRLFELMHWNILEYKWVDCIIHTEEVENDIINKIKGITVGNVKE